MFVQQTTHRDFQIVTSEDGGHTLRPPTTAIEGPRWNISTAMVTRPDALYWAMCHDSPEEFYHGKVMVRLDRSMSPMEPKAWSMSNVVPRPEIPSELTRDLSNELSKVIAPSPVLEGVRRGAYWLEPNTVEVAGRVRVFTLCNIDRRSTANIAAVLDYDTAANHLSFTQFSSWPGA